MPKTPSIRPGWRPSRQDDSLTEEEKAEQLAAIENDPEYIQLQADLAELELRIAALNTSWKAGGGGRQTVAGDAGAAKRADPPAGG